MNKMLWIFVASAAAFASMQETPLFRADVRLVEVYARVFDSDAKYISNLTKEDFEIKDNGEFCRIETFEPITTGFSCAIMIDRTGSILSSLPAIKNAVIRFIDAFRPEDSFAIYDFNVTLRKTQDFTQDKNAAKQAVLHAIASGSTAFFDSTSEVLLQLSRRKGKKAIVSFTDGEDNSSFVNAASVTRRAKSLGIPLYFIAQGKALAERDLMDTLREMSRATSGETYKMEKVSGLDRIFQDISQDLKNSYLLTYVPPATDSPKWRIIELRVKGVRGPRIQAREGYFPAGK